jgi:hypothetical protein
MNNRLAALCITGAATLQTTLVVWGLPGVPCPLRHVVGIPCPGCGLSRAVVALLNGDWETALTLHAFAPFLLLALVLIGCAAVLPRHTRKLLSVPVAWMERRTNLTGILLVGLVFYWLARLVLTPAAFIQLING